MWIWLLTGWVVASFPLAMLCGAVLHRFGHESAAPVAAEMPVLAPRGRPRLTPIPYSAARQARQPAVSKLGACACRSSERVISARPTPRRWPSSVTTSSASTSTRPRSPAVRRTGAVLRAGLPELLCQARPGRPAPLHHVTDARPAKFGEVHFVCVGTPQKKGEFAADMSFVDAAFARSGAA